MSKTKDVSTPSEDFLEMAKARALPNTLMGGTEAMRKAKQIYLPQEMAESEGAYKNRLNRSILFNKFEDTVSTLTGLVFAKPVVLHKPIPDIEEWAKNIDLAGRDLTTFARDILRESGLVDGIGFILVDYQRRPEGVQTVAQEKAAGLRPYLIHVKAENLIGWKTDKVGGVMTLTQVRIKECVEVPDGDFDTKDEEQIRVLEPGLVRLYRNTDGKGWTIFEEWATSLDFIPLVAFYGKRDEFMEGCPPLSNLAWLNLKHWQVSSDYTNINHVVCVPILFGAGMATEGTKLEIGASRMVTGPEGSTLAFVEHSGAALGGIERQLANLEAQMERFSGEMVATGVAKTATETGIDENNAHSKLQNIALGLQAALDQALKFMCEWVGLDLGEGHTEVNTDFDESDLAPQTLLALNDARSKGLISQEVYSYNLKRGEMFPKEWTTEDEKNALDAEGPKPMPMGLGSPKPGMPPNIGQPKPGMPQAKPAVP
jgi:hypothetical protein